MPRDLTTEFADETVAVVARPVMFYEGEFASGTVRLWTGYGMKQWDGKDWTGAGSLLGVSKVTETSDMRATGLVLTLSGISSDVISLVMTQVRLGKQGTVWFGFMAADDSVIVDPYLAFRGKLDQPSITDEGKTCTISVSYESELIDLERVRVFRWTHETQLALHPNSLGFQYQSQQADIKLVF